VSIATYIDAAVSRASQYPGSFHLAGFLPRGIGQFNSDPTFTHSAS